MLEADMLETIELMVERFAEIGKQHIQDMPIYNAALHVEAIGFQSCTDGLIGALITPWFINIMLLPQQAKQWQGLELGSRHPFQFASGEQEFFLGEDDVLGHYLFRTVKSPTHCFKQQAEAQAVAQQALQQLVAVEQEQQPATGSQQVVFNPQARKSIGRRAFMRNLFFHAEQ